jgi:putative transposase
VLFGHLLVSDAVVCLCRLCANFQNAAKGPVRRRYVRVMARPLREVEPGGIYHLGSRGNNRQPVYWSDDDRNEFLRILAEVTRRWEWIVLTYCLMPNHFHLVVQVPQCGLSEGMQFLNGEYARRTNAVYGRTGHLFRNRFWSEFVESEDQLLVAVRYVVLNPVRAGLCSTPERWRWSGHRACAGLDEAPAFLAVDYVLRLFGNRRVEACLAYRRFVSEGQALVSNGQSSVSDAGFRSG